MAQGFAPPLPIPASGGRANETDPEEVRHRKRGRADAANLRRTPFAAACQRKTLMASAATWGLPSPSALVDGRAASPRRLPSAAPRCVGRVHGTAALCYWTARSVVVMATGDSMATTTATTRTTTTSGETTGEGSTEFPEIVQTVQKAWDKVEDKYAVASLAFAVVIALWTSTGVISAIDRLPLVPGVLELVGIGYTGWFIYQNLVFKPDREALIEKAKSTYDQITGSS